MRFHESCRSSPRWRPMPRLRGRWLWRAMPAGRSRRSAPAEGRIEATATTLLFGFNDDVVIRVTPTPRGSRVDVRSESRIGHSDIGTNAKRVESFLDALARGQG